MADLIPIDAVTFLPSGEPDDASVAAVVAGYKANKAAMFTAPARPGPTGGLAPTPAAARTALEAPNFNDKVKYPTRAAYDKALADYTREVQRRASGTSQAA